MKGKNLKVLKVVSYAVDRLAATASSAACMCWSYQPKTPKSLQK